MNSNEYIEEIDFYRYWLILKRRLPAAIAVFGIIVIIFMVLGNSTKPSYEVKGKLLFKADRTSSLIGVGKDAQDIPVNLDKKDPISTEIEVITSNPILEKSIESLKLKDQDGLPIKPGVLKTQLKLKNIPGTEVLEISYKSSNPKEAANLVNHLMELYIQENILTNRAEATLAREFIAKQLPTSERTVRQAEIALRLFKEKNKIISLEEEGKTAVEVISILDQRISIARSELANVSASLLELRKKLDVNPQQAINLIALTESPGVQQVLKQLQKLEEELALEQSRFLDSNPQIISLKAKKSAIEEILQERIYQVIGNQNKVDIKNLQMGELKQKIVYDFVATEIKRLGLTKELDTLSKARNTYKQQLDNLPKLEQDQRELERRLKAAQSTYEVLLENLQEARVAENKNTSKARIIEPALVPDKPSSRKKLITIALSFVVGFIAGVAAIIILEILDQSIKTSKEIQTIFRYTLLGTIPNFKKRRNYFFGRNLKLSIPELPVLEPQHQQIIEKYHILQANVKFITANSSPRLITITSTVPGEGKSTVAANLAAAIAQLGRKVLLVDANLRHPLQHQIWNVNNQVGLTDVIVGQMKLGAAVHKVMNNLDVLTSGDIDFNPLAVIDSPQMKGLLQYCTKNYEFVIVDATPLITGVEALTLGKITDGMLLTVKPGVIDKDSAKKVQESLARFKINVVGMVINGVNDKNNVNKYAQYLHPPVVTNSSRHHQPNPISRQRKDEDSGIFTGKP